MTFELNTEQAIDYMEKGIVMCLLQRSLALFAVMCITEDGLSSHGGPVVAVVDGQMSEEAVRRAIDETVAAALDANLETDEDHACHYVPVPIGLPPPLLYALTRQLYQLPIETQMTYEEKEAME